jgi:hypothetical protein
MTSREIKIVKAVLGVLHDADGMQLTEIQIHAEIGGTGFCSVAELAAALALCDTRKWITGVAGTFGKKKWNINDRGEAARLELMNE